MNHFALGKPKAAQKAFSALAIMALSVGGFASLFSASIAHADNGFIIEQVSIVPSTGALTSGQSADVYFTASNHDATASLNGACTVNDVDVSPSFQNLTGGLYKVVYTVGPSDTERASGQIPVNCSFANASSSTAQAVTFTDSNSVKVDTNNDGIVTGSGGAGTTTPASFIASVSAVPDSGTISEGQSADVYFTAGGHDSKVALNGACTVNNVDVASSFQNLTDGLYKVVYTVGASDTDRAAGQIPVSCLFQNGAGSTTAVSGFTDQNSLAVMINGAGGDNGGNNGGSGGGNGGDNDGNSGTTTSPVTSAQLISAVSIIPSSGTLSDGQSADIYFSATSSDANLTLGGACNVNDVNVASSFQNLTGGLYKVVYTIGSTSADRAAGQIPLSCMFQNQAGATSTVVAFTDSNTLAIDSSAQSGGDNGGSNTGGSMGGTVTGGGDADLAVTSVEQASDTATAGGGYGSGWAWIFHVTVPSDETSLSMKFADWVHSNGTDHIAAADNIRFWSLQAQSTSTVAIAAADAYSGALILTGDADSNTPGRQVDIHVEMQVPSNAVNGSYTTNYGIKTE
ncbi:MAG TPA: hypothetical protein VHE10_03725 [Candidatus Paceibacterota bacterium]|nr:hypothetical protein [Candidatus Paceibacterota bacterium]